MRTLCRTFLAATAIWCLTTLPSMAASGDITVFAAASTTNALTEIVQTYAQSGHGKVTLAFGASSTLAKQIEHGAPAALFLSANANWMDYLENKQVLDNTSRADLLGNRIVLIAPAQSSVQQVEITPQLDLSALLGKEGRLAVGDPAHVPVGTYAKTALQHLGLWDQVANRLAPAKDVRAGMVLVERGEAPLGIVYASDAVISDKVRVIGLFPAASHPKVNYPAAVIRNHSTDPARRFMDFMRAPEAKAIWLRHGFEVL